MEKLQAIAHALSLPVSFFFTLDDGEEVYLEDEREKELISRYRKAQRDEVKDLMVNFAIMVAEWEKDRNGI